MQRAREKKNLHLFSYGKATTIDEISGILRKNKKIVAKQKVFHKCVELKKNTK
jgi:hypothetical protein